jgi:alpha-pyrone synthase
MKPGITAIGIANPSFKIDQQKAAELVSTTLNASLTEQRIIKSIYRFTGIRTRYSVLSDVCSMSGEFEFFPKDIDAVFPTTSKRLQVYKDNALKLALAAINNCLEQLQDFNIKNITHVITISCTGMYAPGLDIDIVQALELDHSTKRTAINFMGCYGAFNGIKVADAICRSEPDANVLVVCVEICTIHFQRKTDIDNLSSNAIFADGASCALIQGRPKQKANYFSLCAFHCDLLPQSSKEMAWHIGDSGFEMILTSYVTEAIERGMPFFADKLIKKNHIIPSEIHLFAIHPGAKKILKACERVLKISPEKLKHSYSVLENFGNMSSATILFVLKSILSELTERDSNKMVYSCAFGPGLTLESMLLKIHTR